LTAVITGIQAGQREGGLFGRFGWHTEEEYLQFVVGGYGFDVDELAGLYPAARCPRTGNADVAGAEPWHLPEREAEVGKRIADLHGGNGG
jgi:hypothetical protein